MSTLTFVGNSQTRKRNSGYDLWIEAGNHGTEQDYELALHGISVAQVALYKRASSTPNRYDTDGGSAVTYTFENGSIVFANPDPIDPDIDANSGWHNKMYAGSDDIYVVYASANANGATDIIPASQFSPPALLSMAGAQGDPGKNVCVVPIYKASSTTPYPSSMPTRDDVQFNFSTGAITNLDNGWYKNPPVGDKIWCSTAIASSTGNSATIRHGSWSEPTVWKEKGEKGDDGKGISEVKYGKSSSSSTTPTDWYDSAPQLSQGDWLWVRTKYTDNTYSYSKSYIGTDGEEGEVGPQGITPKLLDIKMNCQTFVKDLRRTTGGTYITIEAVVSGYEGYNNITWTATAGTITDNHAKITTITIPYTTESKVTITLTITRTLDNTTISEYVSKEIDFVDNTEWNKNFGCISALPDGVKLEGDCFVASATFGEDDRYKQGIPYYWDGDSWEIIERENTVIKNRFELLGSALDSDITIPAESVLYQWVDTLTAFAIFAKYIEADRIKTIIQEIEELIVNKSAKFQGTIVSDVLNTALENVAGETVESTIASSDNAKAIRGSEVKANILSRAGTLSTYTTATATTSYGFFGHSSSDFNKIMRTPDTVSSQATALASLTPTYYDSDQFIQWQNNKNVPVKVYTSYTPKSCWEEDVGWVVYSGPTSEAGVYDPSELVTPQPANPNINDTWVDIYDIAGPTSQGKYYWKERVWRYQVTDTYETTGTVKVYIDNVEQSSPYSGKAYTLQSGSTIKILLNGIYAVSTSSTYAGSASILWKEAENFKQNDVLFIKDSTPKFYLSDISDNFYANSVDLSVSSSYWVRLAINSSTWTYNSTYGTIRKYKKFKWDSTIGSQKTSNMFLGSMTMYLTGVYQGNTYVGTIGSSQTTYNPASITYNDNYANIIVLNTPYTLDSNTYVVSCDISFTTISEAKGVYTDRILPREKGTYDIGSSNQSDGVFNHFGYVNGNSQGKANPNDQFKVWGAVFN